MQQNIQRLHPRSERGSHLAKAQYELWSATSIAETVVVSCLVLVALLSANSEALPLLDYSSCLGIFFWSIALAMSTNVSDNVVLAAKPRQSGIRTVLQYTGIPPSWLDKRPKLPSRNWLIFIGVTSAVTGYYFYDRRQCKQIRQEYVDKVKHLAEVPLHSMDYPRKITVYGSKWPGDEDYDQSMRYFRKYVKVRHTLLSSCM